MVNSLEQFDPPRLVVEVEYLFPPSRITASLDDDGDEGTKHHQALEGVSPDHCLKATLANEDKFGDGFTSGYK